jgi:hypothetical protein
MWGNQQNAKYDQQSLNKLSDNGGSTTLSQSSNDMDEEFKVKKGEKY